MASIKQKIKLFLKKPHSILLHFNAKGYFKHLSDKTTLKLIWFGAFGKRLNLKTPKTFNEKLQWLKLYNRKPIYTTMVDKYEAKKYIASIIGDQYVIPTLGIWDKFEDINFDSLPDRFVLKCTHDSGGLVICRDKSNFDIDVAREKICKSLKQNYYLRNREWPYKNVPPRIIAEKYLDDKSGDAIQDFKFFCFDGTPKIMYISRDKSKEPRTDFFDMDFNHLNIRMRDENSDILPSKPAMFEEMKTIATVLSKGFPHIRVDFYSIDGKIYLGELTFFHCSGLSKITPVEWEYTLGDWINLPQ